MDYNPQFIRQAQFIIWSQWVFFNLFGWAFGLFATWGTQTETITRFGWVATFLGVGQWLVLRRYLRRPAWVWIGLTALGMMAAQFLSQQFISQLTARNIVQLQGIGILGGVVVGGIIGILIGLCIGLAQLPLIVRRGTALRDWLIVSVVGWGLGFQAGTVFGSLLPFADDRLISTVSVLLASIISGLWVTQLVRSYRQ